MDSVRNSNTRLSETLKHYRRLKTFSQEGLAEASGISIRTIQRIETGESVGSAYTIKKLATTLGIDVSNLTDVITTDHPDHVNSRKKLNLVNLSALSVILLPLSNIIFPLLILSKNRNDSLLNESGRKILNFQVLWTLSTVGLIFIIPLLFLLFNLFRGGSIPLWIAVYYVCVMVNVCCTLRFSVAINNQQRFLDRIPNIL